MLRDRSGKYVAQNTDELVTHAHIEMTRSVRLMCSPIAVKIAEDVISSLEKVCT